VAIEQLANSAQSTTTGSVDGVSNPVTFSVVSAAAFPTVGQFRVLIDSEILLVTSVSGAAFTASRAQEGTTIASHMLGATATHVLTAGSVRTLYSNYVSFGLLSALPAAGLAGRLYFPTVLQGSYYLDNGIAWTKFSPGNAALYPPFAVTGTSDEFDNNSFSGWTSVNDGTHLATITEANDCLSLSLPGSDAAGHLQAYMKSATLSTGAIIEMAFSGLGIVSNFIMCGLVFADGATYNAGNQIVLAVVPSQNNLQLFAQTGFNTQGGVSQGALPNEIGTAIFLQLVYTGVNSWTANVSADGISWATMIGPVSITMTPSFVGFFATTWGAAVPFTWSIRYFRQR
jgi:hypothetical protein